MSATAFPELSDDEILGMSKDTLRKLKEDREAEQERKDLALELRAVYKNLYEGKSACVSMALIGEKLYKTVIVKLKLEGFDVEKLSEKHSQITYPKPQK